MASMTEWPEYMFFHRCHQRTYAQVAEKVNLKIFPRFPPGDLTSKIRPKDFSSSGHRRKPGPAARQTHHRERRETKRARWKTSRRKQTFSRAKLLLNLRSAQQRNKHKPHRERGEKERQSKVDEASQAFGPAIGSVGKQTQTTERERERGERRETKRAKWKISRRKQTSPRTKMFLSQRNRHKPQRERRESERERERDRESKVEEVSETFRAPPLPQQAKRQQGRRNGRERRSRLEGLSSAEAMHPEP